MYCRRLAHLAAPALAALLTSGCREPEETPSVETGARDSDTGRRGDSGTEDSGSGDSESGKWSSKTSDVDGDKNVEIEIGPYTPEGTIETRATFRYSNSACRYLGPEGSLSGEFYLVPDPVERPSWNPAEDFARAHGIPVVPSKRCGERPNQ